MSGAASVLSSQQGAVVTLTLNRPERLNALDSDMATVLCDAIEAVKNNASARVVVLRGEGASFCCGGDVLSMHAQRDDLPGFIDQMIDAFHGSIMGLSRLPIPVIACVKGAVAGGGFSLALACDLVVAARSTRFVVAYPKLGVPADGGLTFRLTRRLGAVQALETLLSPAAMNADKALALGLINRVVADHEVEAETLRWAHELMTLPVQSVNELKQLVAVQSHGALEAHLAREKAAFLRCAANPDVVARIAAFVNKTRGAA